MTKATGEGKGTRESRRGKRRRLSRSQGEDSNKEELSRVRLAPPTRLRKKCAKAQGSNRPSLLDKLRLRLSGGHFRMLNEKLYTCSGNEAFRLFKDEPELFDVYHAGYQEQMSRWPKQPVNIIINWLRSRNSSLIVADFGCGNASLAKAVNNKVFSIDLVPDRPIGNCL
ncbi:hypothetical protein HPP92_019789 [Vanilla planifolia]|uniref:Ribosomal RNA-processing protein 8 n=1 Tax=Vanilla planifolia TaxID=51239 RepID=A0A835UM35_VANPL|nr:hypothetical protein HPP92_019789 [Vanilla planifolia]